MRRSFATALAAVGLAGAVFAFRAQGKRASGCDADNARLTLPPGFCAGVYARGVPSARHMAVAPNGDVFVITNPGRRNDTIPPLRGIYRLRDANGDGKADSSERIAAGTGSGILVVNNALYAEGGGSSIVRYALNPGTADLTGAVDTIVSGLPRGPDHVSREFVIRGNDLFVNVGSPSNICDAPPPRTNPAAQQLPSGPQPSPDPCPELATRAGIWKFDANKTGQVFGPAARYVTGLRNGPSLVLNPRDNEMYVVQHGRDDLRAWNNTVEYNAENPGEEFFHIVADKNYGWPYCFYSIAEHKKVTNPEYGGDGKKDDRCGDKEKPIYAFPGHWAPDGLLFYTGTQFPAEYRNGVFVAFHGSWNRAPLPQAGFNVTFLPLKNGKADGEHKVFADGFYDNRPSQNASHRPVGVSQMLDGSMLVSDDAGGLIYRIVYTGR